MGMGEVITSQSSVDLASVWALDAAEPFGAPPVVPKQAQVDGMANDLLDKIPAWLKSLWHMENELRNAARNGLILRKDEASAHLAEARRHLEEAMSEAKGIEPANGPQTPLRKEGEV
jgi:hypothetical protein